MSKILMQMGQFYVVREGNTYKIFRHGTVAAERCGLVGVSMGMGKVRETIERLQSRHLAKAPESMIPAPPPPKKRRVWTFP